MRNYNKKESPNQDGFWPGFLIRAVLFLSAFLLFQVEFIVGKIFLPNFGGSFMVWGACLVFFQAALLLGYFYAHGMARRFGVATYRRVHALVFLLPLLFFPGRFIPLKFHVPDWPMVLAVFGLLAVTVAPVFLLLSATSPLCQAWTARSNLKERDNPFALFGVSNLGSFLALLSYPFLFESHFDLETQQRIWRGGYLLLVILYGLALRCVAVNKDEESSPGTQWSGEPGALKPFLWFVYGAGGVTAFMAVTNILTVEIAPVPLLWMVPLMLYLLSYVLTFKRKSWQPAWLRENMAWVVLAAAALYFLIIKNAVPVVVGLILMLGLCFLLCLFCQGRLFALRPPPARLTTFYVYVSLGGLAGGVAASWIVVLISQTYLEYFLALLFLTLAWQIERGRPLLSRRPLISFAGLFAWMAAGSFIVEEWAGPGILLWLVGISGLLLFAGDKRGVSLMLAASLAVFLPGMESLWQKEDVIFARRNYYGVHRVLEKSGIRFLAHGFTLHGAQFTGPGREHIPLMYYNPRSPAAEMIIHNNPRRIGIVGLGTGALAVYARPGDRVDFYELDADVIHAAGEYFSYLDISPARIGFVVGDARLSLEERPPQMYDLLVIDAFSGDSVPVHFLTKEAVAEYRRHLSPGGAVVFHLTNHYLALPRALGTTALDAGAFVLFKQDLDFISGRYHSDWMALTWDAGAARRLDEDLGWDVVTDKGGKAPRPWTDQYSSVIPYFINWRGLKAQMYSGSLPNF